MKRFVLIVLFICMLTPILHGEIGSKGLIIEDGKSTLELQKGDKLRLTVQDGFTKRVRQKGLTFYSDNKAVASIEKHSGILHANSIGTARISVIDKEGDAGTILIKVSANMEKSSPIPLLIILAALAGFGFFLVRK